MQDHHLYQSPAMDTPTDTADCYYLDRGCLAFFLQSGVKKLLEWLGIFDPTTLHLKPQSGGLDHGDQ